LSRKIPSFATNADVTKVTLQRGSELFEMERTKDDKAASSWKLTQPKQLAGRGADPGKVSSILNELRTLEAERLFAEKANDQELERYGLKPPVIKATVTITKADKKTEDMTYLLGKETDDKTGIYAKLGDRDLIFIVRKSVADALQGDLRDPTVVSFDPAKVKGMKLVGWQDIVGSPHMLDLERKGTQNWLAKGVPDGKVDNGKVEGFVISLSNLRAEQFVGPVKPEYKVELKEGALEISIQIEGEKEPLTLTVGAPKGGEGYYARSNKLPGEVVVIPKGNLEQAKSKPAYFK
jgi:hypothetical protein